MTISIQNARQGDISENHAVSKVLVISTSIAFIALGMLALLG